MIYRDLDIIIVNNIFDDAGGAGGCGPDAGMDGWVRMGWVRKIIYFW
jgi:hypothetical protein